MASKVHGGVNLRTKAEYEDDRSQKRGKIYVPKTHFGVELIEMSDMFIVQPTFVFLPYFTLQWINKNLQTTYFQSTCVLVHFSAATSACETTFNISSVSSTPTVKRT